jgi:hypothetical protein
MSRLHKRALYGRIADHFRDGAFVLAAVIVARPQYLRNSGYTTGMAQPAMAQDEEAPGA